MAHAALIFTKLAGGVGAVGNASLVPLLEQAQKARVTGLVNDIPVERGVVLAEHKLGPAYTFAVETEIRDKLRNQKTKSTKKANA